MKYHVLHFQGHKPTFEKYFLSTILNRCEKDSRKDFAINNYICKRSQRIPLNDKFQNNKPSYFQNNSLTFKGV